MFLSKSSFLNDSSAFWAPNNNFSKLSYNEKQDIYKLITPKLLHNRDHYISDAANSSANEFSKVFNALEEIT